MVNIPIAEATYLLSAVYRWHELYLGLFTELGNLHSNDRLHKATAEGFAGSQREMHNKINLEAEYRSVMQGQTKP